MAKILTSLNNTIIAGGVLTVLLFILYFSDGYNGADFGVFFIRWLHVVSGVMWIGLLWYFNFVQIPNMPNIPDDQKPAIGKVIAPAALFWFRWGAMSTIITGIIVAAMNKYLGYAVLLGLNSGEMGHTMIGIGMWLGVIMWFNVWFIIWPNQKKALGIVEVDADTKAKAGRTAMLFSRTNTLLSIPMLYAMVSAQNLYCTTAPETAGSAWLKGAFGPPSFLSGGGARWSDSDRSILRCPPVPLGQILGAGVSRFGGGVPSQASRSARARALYAGLRWTRLMRPSSGGNRPKLMFIGWKVSASAPPVMWFRSAPSAVVAGGGCHARSSRCAAAIRPVSRPQAALSR